MGLTVVKLSLNLLLWGLIQAVATNGGLSWVSVNVPQYRVPGDTALLQCNYDLGNGSLYSVKWYKDHEEFYRFVPKTRPQATAYRVQGATVDLSKSDSRKVVLHPVDWKTSGLYRCEVSAEAPAFSSAQSESRMEVIYFPQEDPIITGVELQYQIGDEITLNCTSGKSHPASILHWYINEQQVTSSGALIRYPAYHDPNGLITTTLGLRFTLSSRHFQGGSMKVKCIASVSPALWRTDRESVVQNLPIKDMREALLLVKSSTTRTTKSLPLLRLVTVLFVIVFALT
ncbi:cell adhesion molecule 2-like isoform X2 [Tenebrio molitor]|uniref:cell adhesion molecule 2-like isoform X2 n=1 Tax=Tenebrio molitor TaxID=7067 RepID=UPI001C39854E|nr:unnamed protein product [Tenebrio molitor]